MILLELGGNYISIHYFGWNYWFNSCYRKNNSIHLVVTEHFSSCCGYHANVNYIPIGILKPQDVSIRVFSNDENCTLYSFAPADCRCQTWRSTRRDRISLAWLMLLRKMKPRTGKMFFCSHETNKLCAHRLANQKFCNFSCFHKWFFMSTGRASTPPGVTTRLRVHLETPIRAANISGTSNPIRPLCDAFERKNSTL